MEMIILRSVRVKLGNAGKVLSFSRRVRFCGVKKDFYLVYFCFGEVFLGN